jgi:hypothetical protein
MSCLLRSSSTERDDVDTGVIYLVHTAISSKVVPEQSGKVEYERERLAGNRYKIVNFLAIPSKLFALVFDFSALLGDNLN